MASAVTSGPRCAGYRYTAGRDEAGRLRRGWTVQHYDSRGRRLWLAVDTKEEAQREADRLRRIQCATQGLAEDVLLEDYVEVWFRRAQRIVRPGTAHVYAWAIDNHVANSASTHPPPSLSTGRSPPCVRRPIWSASRAVDLRQAAWDIAELTHIRALEG